MRLTSNVRVYGRWLRRALRAMLSGLISTASNDPELYCSEVCERPAGCCLVCKQFEPVTCPQMLSSIDGFCGLDNGAYKPKDNFDTCDLFERKENE